jgi:hypothetical protein
MDILDEHKNEEVFICLMRVFDYYVVRIATGKEGKINEVVKTPDEAEAQAAYAEKVASYAKTRSN